MTRDVCRWRGVRGVWASSEIEPEACEECVAIKSNVDDELDQKGLKVSRGSAGRRFSAGGRGYYHQDRTHLASDKQTPTGRVPAKSGGAGCSMILTTSKLGGLHHRYDLAA
jgi:hypothetical protein